MKDNHKPWLQFIKSRLRAKGLWGTCETAAKGTPADKEKAHGLITQFMNEEYREMVDNETSPEAVLKVIKKHFMISMPTCSTRNFETSIGRASVWIRIRNDTKLYDESLLATMESKRNISMRWASFDMPQNHTHW